MKFPKATGNHIVQNVTSEVEGVSGPDVQYNQKGISIGTGFHADTAVKHSNRSDNLILYLIF